MTPLKLKRLMADIPQWEAAREVGIPGPHLSLAENGKKTLERDVLRKLARLYGCRIKDLTGDCLPSSKTTS